jgi:hypothetical protein
MSISLKKTLTTVLTIGIIGFCSNFLTAQEGEGGNGNPCRCHSRGGYSCESGARFSLRHECGCDFNGCVSEDHD